jgi:hypothetical protein
MVLSIPRCSRHFGPTLPWPLPAFKVEWLGLPLDRPAVDQTFLHQRPTNASEQVSSRMYFSRTILSLAAASVWFFANSAAAQDISVVGEHVTSTGPSVPDINVVGVHSTSGVADINVVGTHLTTGTAGAAPDTTGVPEISVAGTWSLADSSDR